MGQVSRAITTHIQCDSMSILCSFHPCLDLPLPWPLWPARSLKNTTVLRKGWAGDGEDEISLVRFLLTRAPYLLYSIARLMVVLSTCNMTLTTIWKFWSIWGWRSESWFSPLKWPGTCTRKQTFYRLKLLLSSSIQCTLESSGKSAGFCMPHSI